MVSHSIGGVGSHLSVRPSPWLSPFITFVLGSPATAIEATLTAPARRRHPVIGRNARSPSGAGAFYPISMLTLDVPCEKGDGFALATTMLGVPPGPEDRVHQGEEQP